MILSKKTQKNAIFLHFLRPTRERVCAVCVRVCRQVFLCLDGSCGMPVETVDARLGIMGKCWGVMRYPVGLHGRSGDELRVLPRRQAQEL